MKKVSRCIAVPHLQKGHHSNPPQKERRQRELERENEEREATKRKEELEVHLGLTSDGTPF